MNRLVFDFSHTTSHTTERISLVNKFIANPAEREPDEKEQISISAGIIRLTKNFTHQHVKDLQNMSDKMGDIKIKISKLYDKDALFTIKNAFSSQGKNVGLTQ